MRPLPIMVLAAAAIALTAPGELWAQGKGKGKKAKVRHEASADRRERDRLLVREDGGGVVVELSDRRRVRGRQVVEVRDLDDFRDRDVLVARDSRGRVVVVGRDDIRNRYRLNQRRGNGPPFCRNGQGHPVHGRQWCIDKGWGLGNRTVFFDDDRVILRSGQQVVIAHPRDDRSVFERIADRILFWSD